MQSVNMFEAKSQLSRLIEAIESKRESEIIIARNGHPVAKLVPLDTNTDTSQRIGIAKNAFEIPDNIDINNDQVAKLFLSDNA